MTHVIALTGYAGVGKDTWADQLVERHGYTKLAFADKLKDLLLAADPVTAYLVNHRGWDDAKRVYPEIRTRLQSTGMAAREILGKDVWINPLIREATSGGHSHVVVSDVRLKNELSALLMAGFESLIVLRLVRSEIGPANDHESETTPLPHDIEVNLDSVGLDELPYAVDSLTSLITAYQTRKAETVPRVWSLDDFHWRVQAPVDLKSQFLDAFDEARS